MASPVDHTPTVRPSRPAARPSLETQLERVNRKFNSVGLPSVTFEEIQRSFDYTGAPPNDPRRAGWMQAFLDNAINTPVEAIGQKPEVTRETDIYLIDIPQDTLSLRLFPGGTRPDDRMFFMDFYDARRNVAHNAPRGYTMRIVSPGGLAGPLKSIEEVYDTVANPGQEKFAIVENVRCALIRPGRPVYLFDIPPRSAPPPDVGQARRIA